jgi:primosomal protein N' (replication factor Y)
VSSSEGAKTGFWHVAVDAPLLAPLTYSDQSLSEDERQNLVRGRWVTIPLGNRQTQGIILGPTPAPDGSFDVKSISKLSFEYPIVDAEYMKWLEWLADYYVYPVGEIMATVLPPLDKATPKNKTRKAAVIKEVAATAPPVLTEEQQQVVKQVSSHQGFGAHLIFGVTGSGKTEVYMRVLEECLARGERGLVIVPEISLTPQLLNRFTARFGQKVATIHSHLTPREKTNQWWQMVDGEKQILIGARSAMFCPIPKLGVVIVDEEHEPSFKQEDYLKYHARDAAVKLAQLKNIPILLGSATPSLESWNNALHGRYFLHRLRRRVEDRSMPDVQIVDLKVQRLRRKDKPSELPHWLSEELLEEMQRQLDNGKQVAVFLNRRGFANVVQCPGCAFVLECPNCDISLTLHGKHHLVCHYCDYQQMLTPICTNCNQSEYVAQGLGTEQIEADLSLLFPQARLARADRDEITSREDIEELVARMESGDIDILIGTQMIAKGLDFPNLNLVGIVNADVGLHMPDFRAAERGFQIITQVSGRSGRHVQPGELPGKVIIQTYTPNHSAIVCAQMADYEKFAEEELKNREELLYPPFGKLAVVRIIGANLDKVLQVSDQMAHRGRELQKKYPAYRDLWILGPTEYPLARLRNQHRYQLLIKGPKANVINTFVRQVIGDRKWIQSQVKVQVDVDPMNML